ncbi:glycosyltransferase family 4 protein [Patescibacteria group bacterium]
MGRVVKMRKKKLKISIFHCGFVYSGGGERVVLEEAMGLKKRGFQVEVVVPTIDKKLCYPDILNKINALMFLPSFIDWLPLRDALRMVGSSILAPILALNFKDTDVFIGANQPGAWIAFCMAKVLKKPYLVYLNQPNRLVYPRKIDRYTGWQTRKDYYFLAVIIKFMKPFISWVDKISIKSAKAILVNGDYIGKWIKKVYKRPVVIAPAGAICQPREKLLLKESSAYKGTIRINGFVVQKPYLLLTNRHEPQKRFEYVIKALKLVLKDYPETCLVISGASSPYTPKLKKLAKKLGVENQIIWIGQVSEKELRKLYQNCAVYCYPAPEEDFGLGPLEAGGFGVPSVAWNHAGPTVTILDDVTGYLANPYEVKDFAQKIGLLLNNPQKRVKMGKAAWKRTRDCFSWDQHIDVLEREIRRLMCND